MRIAFLLILLTLIFQQIVNGQTEIIKRKPIDTLKISPIKKLLILVPIVPNNDRIIRNTMKSAIVEEIDTIIDFHFVDNDKFIEFSHDTVYLNYEELINSISPYDAVLIPLYGLVEVFDNSGHYSTGYNYSLIGMFLFDKKGELIRKRIFSALSADKYGFKVNPIKGIKTATMLATYSMIKKINRINKKNLL